MSKDKKDDVDKKMDQKENDSSEDLFKLEDVYPDPAIVFQAHDIPAISDNSVMVVLDTNALLLPYGIALKNLKALDDVYKKLSDEERIFIPARVAREFAKNRDKQLADLLSGLNLRKSQLPSTDMPSLLEESAGFSKVKDELKDAKKAYAKALEKIIDEVKSWRGNDPVAKVYTNIFQKKNIIELEEKDKEKLTEEMRRRYKNKIPPGYKDGQKDDEGIGDFLIWKTLLEIGKKNKQPMAFITGEKKADWFTKGNDNDPVYPRYELIAEYKSVTSGQSIRLMSLHELLSEMKVPETVVKEVKTAEDAAEKNRVLKKTTADNETVFWGGGPSSPINYQVDDPFQRLGKTFAIDNTSFGKSYVAPIDWMQINSSRHNDFNLSNAMGKITVAPSTVIINGKTYTYDPMTKTLIEKEEEK